MSSSVSDLQLVSSLYRTTNAVVRELDRRLVQEHDVTFVQAITLMAIDNFERPQPRLVADFLSQQSQTVTGVLDRLERAGHVLRLRDLGDRRAVRLELSPSGRRLADDLGASLQRHVRELVGGLQSESRHRLTRLLDDLDGVVHGLLQRPQVAS